MNLHNNDGSPIAKVPETTVNKLDFSLTEPKINEDFTNKPKLKDIGRWYVTESVKKVSDSLPCGTTILDAGAGECAYKKLFSHCKYISVDLAVGEKNGIIKIWTI